MEWRAGCAGKKEPIDPGGKWSSSLLAKGVKKVYFFCSKIEELLKQ